MKLYTCKVRHGGSLHNEVLKNNVTAPEIRLLQHIHGHDAILDIYEMGDAVSVVQERDGDDTIVMVNKADADGAETKPWTDRLERMRLARQYAKANNLMADDYDYSRVNAVFGPAGALPKEIDADEVKGVKEGGVKPRKRGRPAKKAAPAPVAEVDANAEAFA